MTSHRAFSKGNVAVITGAADGIGLAAAKRLTVSGLNVVMVDIDEDKLRQAADEVRNANHAGSATVIARAQDVSSIGDIIALKELVFSRFGHVDVLMNNAGTSLRTSSWESYDHWQRLLEVNLWGIVNGMHAFTQAMIDQQRPALIINTGSKQGITNPPGNPAYNVSKAGVKAATECLQHELRELDNCQVSAHLLVPGFTYTGLVKRHVKEKPGGAWDPEQVVDFMIERINAGKFYIICPDNEVSSDEDARRILWGAGDLVYGRPALSRWDPEYSDQFERFKLGDEATITTETTGQKK